MDRPYRVTWKPGAIIIHVPDGKSAIEMAKAYILQLKANRFTVEPDDTKEKTYAKEL